MKSNWGIKSRHLLQHEPPVADTLIPDIPLGQQTFHLVTLTERTHKNSDYHLLVKKYFCDSNTLFLKDRIES